MTAGCGLRDAVSPSDAVSRPASSEAVPATGVSEAVEILVDGEKTEDVFLLSSSWYGVSYQNEDSLNKLMMMKYAAKDSVIPQARNGARVNIRFAASEGVPEELTVTQQGNTVQANTGIPYDIRENELTRDEDGGCVPVEQWKYRRICLCARALGGVAAGKTVKTEKKTSCLQKSLDCTE